LRIQLTLYEVQAHNTRFTYVCSVRCSPCNSRCERCTMGCRNSCRLAPGHRSRARTCRSL